MRVERLLEAEGATYTTRGQVTEHPHAVAITVLLEAEHLLELVTESKVQGLGREVSDDVGSVTTPQGQDTLVGGGTLEAVGDTGIAALETTGLDHLILSRGLEQGCSLTRRPGERVATNLVLDEELDTLDGGSGSLGDSSGNTTHCKLFVSSICSSKARARNAYCCHHA